ncbi:MAG TPA: peroxide stress protein YaaA, partial [Dermatophilaceae bacterium]
WVPRGDLAARWVQVRVPSATHQAKHTRGLVARHLCEEGVDVRTARALHQVLAQRFETKLTEPARLGGPWILDALVR